MNRYLVLNAEVNLSPFPGRRIYSVGCAEDEDFGETTGKRLPRGFFVLGELLLIVARSMRLLVKYAPERSYRRC